MDDVKRMLGALVTSAVLVAGCNPAPVPIDTGVDAGGTDAGAIDTGPGTDVGPVDASGLDSGGSDGGGVDAPVVSADANLDANGVGPIVNVACGDLAADFPGFVDFAGATPELSITVCLDATGCHVTNDYRNTSTPAPYQCALENQVFRIAYSRIESQWVSAPQSDFTTRWATTGVARTWPRSTPVGVDLTAIVERPDGTRYEIVYRVSATSVHVESVTVVSPPVPAWGATDDCERMPRTYDTSVELYGIEVYARVCIEIPPYPSCNVAGDIDATPEDESCALPLALGVDPATGQPWAQASFPYDYGFLLESASAGTIDPDDGTTVTGLPTGTDVTFVVSRSRAATGETYRFSIVAQWTGTSWTVQSVTEL